ncbi:hypothetical protein SEA_TRIBUTE_256 [Streptomyces phage Tribute]|uniref:Uncharacterized protein n=4 Tax=Samistivirus peebs TaxID=2560790 RepID=A0A5Q2WIW4_9CAUD|nr:hypothetical protein SEA_SUSHI23_11 [Streptomyces phage Sushi23]QAX95747.1 hypothetical protein SEA_TEUTSCH_10 [Streptomyces phage Teutsch]QGH78421.1 hypothetical protein SEA_TRIBUTE_10 [Streptomyces phage Tribute]QRI46007.1 hypothetical protein SEA_CROSS_10 [Streptomyces phage Cross]WDS51808.1 hypothetical protein SEA_PEPPERWOOD_11 [Streptomyces phage Pepperwood]WNN95372.1 hypothetical protein SEA_WATERMOORE_10 [Streptomyces phage Watermoore]
MIARKNTITTYQRRRSDILANLPVPRVVRVQVEVKPLNEVHVYS